VTGQLVRVDLPSGTARIVNAGHRHRSGSCGEGRGGQLARRPAVPVRVARCVRGPGTAPWRRRPAVVRHRWDLERNASAVDVRSLYDRVPALHAAKRYRNSHEPSSVPAAESFATTPLSCASTGTATPRKRDSSSERIADRAKLSPAPEARG
jgi:hypothetical protein